MVNVLLMRTLFSTCHGTLPAYLVYNCLSVYFYLIEFPKYPIYTRINNLENYGFDPYYFRVRMDSTAYHAIASGTCDGGDSGQLGPNSRHQKFYPWLPTLAIAVKQLLHALLGSLTS